MPFWPFCGAIFSRIFGNWKFREALFSRISENWKFREALFSLKSLWFQRFDIFCAIVKNDFIKRTPFLMKRFKKTCNRQYFHFIFANRRFLYISRGFIFANCQFLKILRGFIFANFGHSRKFIPAKLYPREYYDVLVSSGFRIQYSGFKIQDSGFKQNSGYVKR